MQLACTPRTDPSVESAGNERAIVYIIIAGSLWVLGELKELIRNP